MKIAVILIHYNTPAYLKTCVASLFQQTCKDLELIFIDNASPDKEGLAFMHSHFDHDPRVTIIANGENKGYARAGNQGIQIAIACGAKYLAITNPDIIFAPDYFEKIYNRLKHAGNIASITGKIYKYDFEKQMATDIIDTVGLHAQPTRRIVDEGQGIVDQGQFAEEKEVFGVSGACPFYRVSALEDIKYQDEYFDEDFFMYKEDVDLAWRLRWRGWKSLYLPDALAYHGRGTLAIRRHNLREIIVGRSRLSRFQKQLSFRNQLLMQFKNESWGTFFRSFFQIFLVKILTPFYITFKEPYLWQSCFRYFGLLVKFSKKREHVMRNRKISSAEMASWFKK